MIYIISTILFLSITLLIMVINKPSEFTDSDEGAITGITMFLIFTLLIDISIQNFQGTFCIDILLKYPILVITAIILGSILRRYFSIVQDKCVLTFNPKKYFSMQYHRQEKLIEQSYHMLSQKLKILITLRDKAKNTPEYDNLQSIISHISTVMTNLETLKFSLRCKKEILETYGVMEEASNQLIITKEIHKNLDSQVNDMIIKNDVRIEMLHNDI